MDSKRISEDVEAALLQDGFEVVEEPTKTLNASVHAKRGSSREQILDSKRRILGRYSNVLADNDSNSIASKISPEQAEMLHSVGRAALEAKLDTIIGDPRKNAKDILKELHTLERSHEPADHNGKERKNKEQELSKDAMPAEGGGVSFEDAKGYLSELVIYHYLNGIRRGKFSNGIPSVHLDTFFWRDGRPLPDVLSKKDQRKFRELAKAVENDLRDINETENDDRRKKQEKAIEDIKALLVLAKESVSRLGQVKDLEELDSIEFPDISMGVLDGIGMKLLPKRFRETISAARKDLINEWKAERELVRRRVRQKSRQAKEKIQKLPKVGKPQKSQLFGGRARVTVGEDQKSAIEEPPILSTERPEEPKAELKAPATETAKESGESVFAKEIGIARIPAELYALVEKFEGSLHEDGHPNNAWDGLDRREHLIWIMHGIERDALSAMPDEFEKSIVHDRAKIVPSQYGLRAKFVELLESARTVNSELTVKRGAEEGAPGSEPEPTLGSADEQVIEGEYEPATGFPPEQPSKPREGVVVEGEFTNITKLMEEKRAEVENLKQGAKAQGDQVAALEDEKLVLGWDLERLKEEERNSKKLIASVLSVLHKKDPIMNLASDIEKVSEGIADLEKKIKDESLKRDELRATLKDAEKELATLIMEEMTGITEVEEVVEPAPEREEEPSEEIPPVGAQETPPIPAYVYERFRKLGITLGDLKEIKDEQGNELFSRLSEGRQILMFENLNQLVYGKIQEEAYRETEKYIAESAWYARVAKSLVKNVLVGKKEKAVAEKYRMTPEEERGERHQDMMILLSQLVANAEAGPEIVVDASGNLEIHFAAGEGFENLSEKELDAVQAFNRQAVAFSKIPDEWRYEQTASRAERKKFRDASSGYKISRIGLIKALESKHGAEKALMMVGEIDYKVRMSQFLSTNPDMENALLAIDEKSVYWKGVTSALTERTGYFLLGLAGRTVGGVLLGSMAAGFTTGWLRAKEDLKKREKVQRKSAKQRSLETKNFSTSSQLVDRLEKLVNKVEGLPEGEERIKVLTLLESRIDFTKRKLDGGLVNFGEDALPNQFEFFRTLAHAQEVAAVHSGHNAALSARVERLLASAAEKISTDVNIAKDDYKRARALSGMALAGVLSGAGLLAREYFFGSPSAGELPGNSGGSGEPSAYLKSTAEQAAATKVAGGAPTSEVLQTSPTPVPAEPILRGGDDDWDALSTQKVANDMPAGSMAEAMTQKIPEAVPEAAKVELAVQPGSGESIEGAIIQKLLRSTGTDPATAGRDAHMMIVDYARDHGIPLERLDRISEAKIDLIQGTDGKLSIGNLDFKTLGPDTIVRTSVEHAVADSPVDAGAVHETVMQTNGDTFASHAGIAEQAVSPNAKASVEELLRTAGTHSETVEKLLAEHPDMLEPYRTALSHAESFILGSGGGGIRHFSDLPESLSAQQVAEENFRVLGGGNLSSGSPINSRQMGQAGEFIANALKRFWQSGEAAPLSGESFKSYVGRMEALSFSKDGKPIDLTDGMLSKWYQNAKQ